MAQEEGKDQKDLWAETEGIVDEMERICSETEDVECVTRCQNLVKELDDVFDNFNKDSRALIRQCSEKVEVAKTKAQELAERTPTSPEIEALEQERQALENRIESQQSSASEMRELVKDLEGRVQDLKKRLEQAKQSASEQLPVMKHSLSLFANVSKIKWNFMHDDPAIIQGSVVDADNGSVENFSIDSREKNAFQVANQLWELIGV